MIALARLAPALLAVAVAVASPDPALLDRAHDELLRSAFIPSAHNVHGELRILRRGDGLCAQTLLYTPMLRRATGRIRVKETRAWPAGLPGHADSLAYLAALEQATTRVLEAQRGGGLQTMAIEFVVGSRGALFAISELEIEGAGTGQPVSIRSLRPIVVREAAPSYVRTAIDRMEAAAFHETAVEESEP
jgi:hypothetical protein